MGKGYIWPPMPMGWPLPDTAIKKAKSKERPNHGYGKGGKPKLTWEQVCELRFDHEVGGIKAKELAIKYSISEGVVRSILWYVNRKYQ